MPKHQSPKTEHRIVRSLSRAVDNTVLLTLLVCLFLAGYSLWDTRQVDAAADPARYETFRPTADDTKSFEELRAMNSDVIGWLTIYGTSIDYPLVKAQKDNLEYMSRNPEGKWESSGSLYVDVQNRADFSDFNTIIHGHHMAEHKMFGDLDLFTDLQFFNEHQYANLYFNNQNHGLEIFAVLKTDNSTSIIGRPNVKGETAQENMLKLIREEQLYGRDISVTTSDHIVVMATCNVGVTNGRYIVVGKLLDHEVANPFPEEEKTTVQSTFDIFSLFDNINTLPVWVWIAILVGLILLIGLLYYAEKQRLYRKRDKKTKKQQ